jgi:hypothetical protein
MPMVLVFPENISNAKLKGIGCDDTRYPRSRERVGERRVSAYM